MSVSYRFLGALRTLARPLFGKGYWEAPGLRSVARWYYRSYRPEHVEIEGNRFYLNYNDGYFSNYVAVHGYWEKMESEMVRRYAKPGMRALDLGANIGYYTLMLSSLVGPSGKVVAFEPEPICFKFLSRSVAELAVKNVEIVQSAVWDHTGEIEFYLNTEDAMDHTAVPIRSNPQVQRVRATAIDDYVGDQSFDFIKMDIQGAEGHALEGMRRLLERHLPEVIITEFWPVTLRKAGTSPEHLFNWLLALGYSIQAIDEDRHIVEPITYQEILDRNKDGMKFFNLLCLR